jgi:uncharacterized membrane protein HdeD (DUF308 family)
MTRNTTPWWLPGTLLILFGIAIVLFPELLALLVASAFLFAGALWLSLAYAARKTRQQANMTYHYWRF